MIETIIGVLLVLAFLKLMVMCYFARKNLKPKVEYIPIRAVCTYHYSNSEDGICPNCEKLADGKPGYYTTGYTMVITRPDGTKEGWMVDQNGK